MRLKKLFPGFAAVVALMMLVVSGAAADQTIVVSGDTASGENEPGWLFNRDTSTSTPYEFNFDNANIGAGSLYVEPITNTDSSGNPDRFDKFIAEYFFLGYAEDFDSISYDFQIGPGGVAADANHFYLNVYTNLPRQSITNFYDCRFDYVPASGSTTAFTTFDVDSSTIPNRVQSRGGATCPTTLGDLPEGSTIRVFAINVGDTSFTDTGLAGYIDNVELVADGMTTTFDFEPAPETKDDCKYGGWMQYTAYEFQNQGDCVSFVVSNGQGS